jgi:hypothetical protein
MSYFSCDICGLPNLDGDKAVAVQFAVGSTGFAHRLCASLCCENGVDGWVADGDYKRKLKITKGEMVCITSILATDPFCNMGKINTVILNNYVRRTTDGNLVRAD